ncbi:uncharacterized protein LOC126190709 isoform X1 [Schistocerca cancellata]|uniref:uncharacterized protein LOC126190709 isoform X1 n=1 Tax=Schistocerca cancellata TaxID=274614 RepID=UPI002118F8EC|nr:uncharacterized protein LOC126190709 isoform X1 [Schistocerca cancellata]
MRAFPRNCIFYELCHEEISSQIIKLKGQQCQNREFLRKRMRLRPKKRSKKLLVYLMMAQYLERSVESYRNIKFNVFWPLQLRKKVSEHVDKEGYGLTDYRTTTMYDYRPHQQTWTKPITPIPEQPHKNRIYLSELTDGNSPKRRGINKFFDDNLGDFYRNRTEKYDLYASYNPGTGEYSNIKETINK